MLNQLLVGRYRVVEVLGEGGLAQTYIAIDQHQPSRPKCAVKLLKPASKDPSFLPIARRLFVTEAEILEKLGRHNQIPQLLAHFEENEEFFIIQEYIEGHTLGTELPVGHRWTENKVILMLHDVLTTLKFVHSYRVIHRDLKPNNLIRRDEDGQIVLIDFGAVKQVSDSRITTKAPLTPKTISIGTQGYMPTEQARGKPRLNSDLYALGMIAIQALTGIDPFNLEENIDGEVIWGDYAQVSDELAAILNQMVRYHFRDRYQSTTEVLQALKLLNNFSVVSQPTLDSNQQGVISSPKSKEFRETKVSLSNEQLSDKLVDYAIAKREEDALDINPKVADEAPLIELRETKVSLDKNKSEKASLAPKQSEVPQTNRKDPWSSWNIDHLSRKKRQKTDAKIQQKNSVIPDLEIAETSGGLVKQDLWGLSESVTNSKQNQHQHPQKSNADPAIVSQTRAIVDSSPEIRETKVSIGNKNPDSHLITPVDLRETKVSSSNEELFIEQKSKDTKALTTNKKAIEKQDNKYILNKPKLLVSNQVENILTVSNLGKIKEKLFLSCQQLGSNIDQEKIKKVVDLVAIKPLSKSSKVLTVTPIKSDLFSLKYKRQILLFGAGTIFLMIGYYTGYKHLKHKQSYHEVKLDLDKIEQFKLEKKYQECITQSIEFSEQFSDLNIQKNSLLSDCYQGQLTIATKLAKESKYKDAINLAIQIPPEQEIYAESQKFVTQWSNNIYQIATNKYQSGKLEDAIAILQAIPNQSPLSEKIEPTSKQWQNNWQLDRKYIHAAEKAIDEKRWQNAIKEAKKVQYNQYWLGESKKLITQAETAIAAEAAAARSTYRTPSRSRSSTYFNPTPTTPTTPTTPIPLQPVIPPITDSINEPSIIESPPEPRKPAVCLNKHSRMPKCQKYR